MNTRGTACCGLYEIYNLSKHKTPEGAMRSFLSVSGFKWQPSYLPTAKVEYGERPFSHVVFSAAHRSKAQFEDKSYGTRFAEFIKAQGFGDVVESTTAVNPNSTNQLKIYVWTIDWKALEKWDKGETVGKRVKRVIKKVVQDGSPTL